MLYEQTTLYSKILPLTSDPLLASLAKPKAARTVHGTVLLFELGALERPHHTHAPNSSSRTCLCPILSHSSPFSPQGSRPGAGAGPHARRGSPHSQ